MCALALTLAASDLGIEIVKHMQDIPQLVHYRSEGLVYVYQWRFTCTEAGSINRSF